MSGLDNDLISDGNDLDDDNDGILDKTEFDCSSAWLAFNATWTQSNATNDAVQINSPVVVASTSPLTFGAGSNGVSTDQRVEFSSLDSQTFAEARTNDDYIQYEFTTQADINAVLLGEMSQNKAPLSSGVLPSEYGYYVGIIISDDGFTTQTVLEYGHYIDEVLPAGWNHDFMLGDNEDYQFEPATTYSIRVFLFNKSSPGPARFDDFAFLTYHCANDLNIDSDELNNHQDHDSDGDGCMDVLEAGFTDDELDGELGGSPVSVDSDGVVTSGSDGYSGTSSTVLDSSIQSGCPDFDDDGLSNSNDLDDDNDGILDLDEFQCTSSFLANYVTWSQSNGALDAFIHNPGAVSSAEDIVVGAGLDYLYVSQRAEIQSFSSNTFAQARLNEEYFEYEFTTRPTINATVLRDLTHTKHPSADRYQYHIGITLSDDDFVTETLITPDYFIDGNVSGVLETDFILNTLVDYQFDPNTQYKFRVYFFNKVSPGVGRWDDFGIRTFNCSGTNDLDGDNSNNHQDVDADGDSCNDVIEAGFSDADGDGQLGGLVPPTVDVDGKVTSGGL